MKKDKDGNLRPKHSTMITRLIQEYKEHGEKMDINSLEIEFEESSEHLQKIVNLSAGETDKEYCDCIRDLVISWNKLEDRFKVLKSEKMSESVHGNPEESNKE